MIRSHSSSVMSAAALVCCSMPALLKAKSRPPNTSTVGSRAAWTSWPRVTSHRTASGLSAELLDQAGGLAGCLLVDVGDHDAGALTGEGQGGGAANSWPRR